MKIIRSLKFFIYVFFVANEITVIEGRNNRVNYFAKILN